MHGLIDQQLIHSGRDQNIAAQTEELGALEDFISLPIIQPRISELRESQYFSNRQFTFRYDFSVISNRTEAPRYHVIANAEKTRKGIEQLYRIRDQYAHQDRIRLEAQWLALNRDRYVGQWIAIQGDRLIANSLDAKAVFSIARDLDPKPLVLQIESNRLPFGGW